MAAGGAAIIQLREKRASSREFYEAAAEAMAFAATCDIRIMINDRVDIAMLLKADGVHLGQEDLPPVHARRLLGDDAVIGYSTHTLPQVAEAVKLPINYLAFGPIFPTSTKDNPDPVVGLNLLTRVKEITGELTLVAIGGIDQTNLRSVLDAGADSAAIIGGILVGSEKIEAKLPSLLAIARESSVNNVEQC